MFSNFSLLSFCGISVCFITTTLAREAIVGGEVAHMHQFPYQVAVLLTDYSLGCGGGILNNNSIITAASCLLGVDDKLVSDRIYVLAGTHDLNRTNARTMKIRVKTVYVPMEYKADSNSTTGDIAILRLQEHLHMLGSSIMKSLKRPSNQRELYSKQMAIIAGFGLHWIHAENHLQTGGHNDSLLRYVQAQVLSSEQCEVIHSHLEISGKHLCARVVQHEHITRGVCIGDGGGPLVYNGIVIGIFSLGPRGCSEKKYSGIYTRVSHYLQFIRRGIADAESSYLRRFNLNT